MIKINWNQFKTRTVLTTRSGGHFYLPSPLVKVMRGVQVKFLTLSESGLFVEHLYSLKLLADNVNVDCLAELLEFLK